MNFKQVMIVFRKEFLELLRDKRTLFTTLLLPVILYPVMIIGFNAIMTRQTGVLEKQAATVAIADSVDNAISASLIADLEKLENFSFIPAADNTQSMYAEKEIQAVVTIKDSLTALGLNTYHVYVQYDAANERSSATYQKIKEILAGSEKRLMSDQLELSGIDPELLKMLDLRQVDTATSQRKMGMLLGMVLPYIMIIMLLSGASVAAADLVAGEKERKTLETLMVSGVGRMEIVIGKYLTILILGMVNLIVNLFSISVSLKYMLSQSGVEMAGADMPIKAIFILLAAMLPLATFFSAVLLSISTFSRNMKEARSYEQPLLIVSMMLAMISFLPAIEMSNLLALIPVVNIALLFKAVMIEDYQISHLLITIFSTLALDIFAIWGTIRLFKTESILFRSDDDGSSLKGIKKNKGAFFNPFNGLIYFSLALILLYYLGSYWQGQYLYRGLVNTQLFIIALPVLLILRLLSLKPKQVLRLQSPKLLPTLLIPFMAIPATMLVAILSQVINTIWPFPKEYLENLSRLFSQDVPLWQSFLVVAVAPGVCEELLFRGFFPRFFEKYGMKITIVLTALLFAAFHLDPFRFVPVFLLGLLLGYITLKSGSIYLSMLSHAINNGLALFITAFAAEPWIKVLISDADNLHYWVAAPALAVFLLALYLFNKACGAKECVES